MPRSPLSKIAQGAHEVDVCPEKDCDYVIVAYAGWVVHMWNRHRIDVRKDIRKYDGYKKK